jgi:hypothetical protein
LLFEFLNREGTPTRRGGNFCIVRQFGIGFDVAMVADRRWVDKGFIPDFGGSDAKT